jgi:hypothetical protein
MKQAAGDQALQGGIALSTPASAADPAFELPQEMRFRRYHTKRTLPPFMSFPTFVCAGSMH